MKHLWYQTRTLVATYLLCWAGDVSPKDSSLYDHIYRALKAEAFAIQARQRMREATNGHGQ